MFSSPTFFVFLTAATVLAIAPGPGMLYVLSRSLAGGKREGVLSSVGTFAGGMVHVIAAGAGVSVILARSALAFSVVKYAGAAYLCYLGVKMILEARRDDGMPDSAAHTPKSSVARGSHRGPESQNRALLPLVYSAVRGSPQRARVPAIPDAGIDFGEPEHVC